MLRTNFALALAAFFTLGSFAACSSSLPEVTVPLGDLAPADTIAFITYSGEGGQQTDTLYHFSSSLKLAPDTARFRSFSVTHAGGEVVLFYAWDGKAWTTQELAPAPKAKLPEVAPDFSGKDVQGKLQTLTQLYAKQEVELIFVSPEATTGLSEGTKGTSRKDSLTRLYLYPLPSDSTVRRLMKQDSLRGIAFSDSLGTVTELRQRYGLSQESKTLRLRIDSLGKIHR